MPITREQWCAALRSGEYKQGRGRMALLNDEDETRFCCLGVACLIAGKPEADLIGQETSQFESVDMGRLYVELALDTSACDRLATLNDKGHTFETIARVVEALPLYRTDEEGAGHVLDDATLAQENAALELLPSLAAS